MYGAYQQFHMKAITMVVGPSMLAELLFSGLILIFLAQLGDSRIFYLLTLILLAGIWLHTAFWAVPLHSKLAAGFDKEAINALIAANWWRTMAWSVRAVLLGIVVYKLL